MGRSCTITWSLRKLFGSVRPKRPDEVEEFGMAAQAYHNLLQGIGHPSFFGLHFDGWMSSRSHALRGNVFQDALRPFPLQWLYIGGRRASKVHSHAERGNEGNRANQKSVNYFTAFLKDAVYSHIFHSAHPQNMKFVRTKPDPVYYVPICSVSSLFVKAYAVLWIILREAVSCSKLSMGGIM